MKRPKIILVIAVSLDGRIARPSWGETHLGSIQDKKLLNKALSDVDATLFGSGTLKAHKSTYLIKERNLLKLNKVSVNQPVSIVAGNINFFEIEWKYFNQPVKRWLITSEDNKKLSSFNFNKIFFFKNSWANTLKHLKKYSINKIALLGGAKLIYSFAKEDLIDEIKITICPEIIGGQFTWIPFEEKNEIFNFENKWEIKTLKVLKTNEIFINYTKKINN